MEAKMAVPTVEFRVEGLRELERNILELAEEYTPQQARRTLNIPMRNAFRIVENQIRNRTPVDTGRLRELVRLESTRPNRFDLAENPNYIWVARAGWFWTSPSTYSFQALAVEYGTRFRVGYRTLRNALENNVNPVLNAFSTELAANITRTATRLARRQLRASRRR